MQRSADATKQRNDMAKTYRRIHASSHPRSPGLLTEGCCRMAIYNEDHTDPVAVVPDTVGMLEKQWSLSDPYPAVNNQPEQSRHTMSVAAILEEAQITTDLAAIESLLWERMQSRSDLLTAAGVHTVLAGGKRLRAALTVLAARSCRYNQHYPHHEVMHAAAAVELIHAASLVHDDLVDRAAYRRGRVTVHVRWDDEVALMLGDYLFALGAAEMSRLSDRRIIAFYAEAVQTIVAGELSPVTCVAPFAVARQQYLYKTRCKTAALFAAACKAGMAAGGGRDADIEAAGGYGQAVGMAFQIADDVLDFVGTEAVLGKPAGNDLRQGTITLPLIYAVANGGSAALTTIVKDPAPSDTALNAAVAEVIDRGGVERARADAQQYIWQAVAHLSHFPASRARQALIDLAAFVVERQQ